MRKIGLLVVAVGVGAACGGGHKQVPLDNVRATGGGSVVALEWKATQAADEHVDVSLVVDGRPEALGQLYAAADDAPGTPATCSIKRADASATEFTCGGTPAYNYFIAALADGAIAVTLVTGTETGEEGKQPTDEKRVEVKRIPVAGGALQVAPYALPQAAQPQQPPPAQPKS